MNNYFIIHGSYGTPYKNWIPWLKQNLTKRNINCIVPHFPCYENQNYYTWSRILQSYVDTGIINENTIFITHSLGGIFIVHFLIEKKQKVAGIITVAGFNNISFQDDKSLYESFYIKEDLNDISKYCKNRICFISKNDPYVPYEEALQFAKQIKGEKRIIENAWQNEYAKEFKELLEVIKK